MLKPLRRFEVDNHSTFCLETATVWIQAAVVEDFPDIEAVRDARPIELAAREARRAAARAAGLPSPAVRVPSAGGEVGINRLLSRLRHAINFAVEEGYIEHSPFYRGSRLVVRPTREQDRTRRLEPGEEQRLLLAANPHLQGLIIAAVSTGCRVGELLSLQWSQVRLDAAGRPRVIELPASKTKTNEAWMIPVGQRLAAVLAMRHNGPDGEPHRATGYVLTTPAPIAS